MGRNLVSIDYSRQFKKQLRQAPNKIQESFRKRRELFLENASHPQLHNHPLTGQWQGCRSFNVTGDWRAIFTEKRGSSGLSLLFIALGTHSQLYR